LFVPSAFRQVPQTVVTDCDVGRRKAKLALAAGRDRESRIFAVWAPPFHADVINARDGRALLEKLDELKYGITRSFHLDLYVCTEVFDVASQLQFDRVRINEWPETHPLHNAPHAYVRPYALVRQWFHGDAIAAIRVAFYKRASL
jgi:hypothetical protein